MEEDLESVLVLVEKNAVIVISTDVCRFGAGIPFLADLLNAI